MLTAEQLKERRNYLGGSDMPIILGLSNYKTPYTLYLEKLGLLESEFEETEPQKWGRLLEPVIRAEFEARHGILVPERNGVKHDTHSFITGNLDGFNSDSNLVWEGKTSSAFMRDSWGDAGSDFIPAEYLTQIATYCSCANADTAYLSVLIGGNEYREYQYNRDLELEVMILEAATNFWSCIQNRVEPELVSIDDCKIKFKTTSPDKILQTNKKSYESYCHLGQVKADIKELEKKQASLQMDIMSYMQDAECLTDETGSPLVTWKATKKGNRVFLLKGV